MKKIAITLAFFALIFLYSNAEEGLGEIDSDPNIRPAGEVMLKFEHKIEVPEITRFKNGALELFPGDTVHLEFEDDDGKLVRPKVVAKVQHPERTITFRMTQDESITMLFRKTKIQKTVALDCEHRGLRSEEFFRTNLYPTEKGLTAGDSWPNEVWLLRISNIEVTSKSASEAYKDRTSQGRPLEQGNSEQNSVPQTPQGPTVER